MNLNLVVEIIKFRLKLAFKALIHVIPFLLLVHIVLVVQYILFV